MKRRAWKWVLGVLAIGGLAFGGLLWSAHRRADKAFERHDRLVKEAFAAIRARPAGRPPLDEPAISGNGWKSYMAALAGFDAIPPADAEEIRAIQKEPEFILDREKLAAIFEKYAPLVDELRKSSRHDKFIPDYPYEQGMSCTAANILEAIETARYLAGQAEYLHEEVQDGPALEALALGLAMGHDTGRSGPILNLLVMLLCEQVEFLAVRDLLAGHSLETKEIELFARKLDRLWEFRPRIGDAYDVEDATIRRSLVDLGTSRGIEIESYGTHQAAHSGRSWRYLFSDRLALAGALGEFEQVFREVRTISALAPQHRAAAMRMAAARVMESKNPIVVRLFPALSKVFERDAVTQMGWTLMRVATAIAWYESERGRVPEKLDDLVPRYLSRVPICPLTGLPLGYRDGAVWSAGKNGVDDGGTPGKDNDPDADDGDVVWRVTRE